MAEKLIVKDTNHRFKENTKQEKPLFPPEHSDQDAREGSPGAGKPA